MRFCPHIHVSNSSGKSCIGDATQIPDRLHYISIIYNCTSMFLKHNKMICTKSMLPLNYSMVCGTKSVQWTRGFCNCSEITAPVETYSSCTVIWPIHLKQTVQAGSFLKGDVSPDRFHSHPDIGRIRNRRWQLQNSAVYQVISMLVNP